MSPLKHATDVVQAVTTPLLVLNSEHQIVEANAQFYQTFGLSPQQTIGQSFFRAAHGLWDTPPYHRLLETVLSDMVPFVELEDSRDSSPGTARSLVVTLRRLSHEGAAAPLSLIHFEDVTQRNRRTRQLQMQASEAERSNRDLEQFAYIASHDLQEPLRMIASYSQLLSRRYKGRIDEDADKYLHYVMDGALRMQHLVNDLLDYARVATQPRNFEDIDGELLLEEALANLRLQIRDTKATIQHDPLTRLHGDPAMLRQLFQNLISNALKFHGDAPPHVQIRTQHHGTMLHIQVRDNGIGIPADLQPKLFRPFQRLHARRDYPGNGIGLAMCRRILERHGGSIRIESDGRTYTTFHIELPHQET